MQEKNEAELSDKPASGPGPLRGLFTDYSKQMTVAMGGVITGTREVLNKVLDILEQGLRDIARARDTVIDTSKRNIADISWIKVKDLLTSPYVLMVSTIDEPITFMKTCADTVPGKCKFTVSFKSTIRLKTDSFEY